MEIVGLFGLIIALILTILTLLQFLEARKDRVDAKQALSLAKEALASAEQAQKKAKLAEDLLVELRSMRQALQIYAAEDFQQTCVIFRGTYNYNTKECSLPDGKSLRFDPPFPFRKFLDQQQ